ncbi:MAG: hypothetical protein QM790_14000 [Nibricoccus sp.]
MKHLWTKVFPLLTCLFFVACSSASKLGDVTVDIIEFGSAVSEAKFNVTLRYVNGNVFPMAIGETRSKLYLNNEYVGTVVQEGPIGIPQIGTVTKPALLTIEKMDAFQKVRSSPDESAAFRLQTVMRLQVSEDKSRIFSNTSGQLSLAALRNPAPEKKS